MKSKLKNFIGPVYLLSLSLYYSHTPGACAFTLKLIYNFDININKSSCVWERERETRLTTCVSFLLKCFVIALHVHVLFFLLSLLLLYLKDKKQLLPFVTQTFLFIFICIFFLFLLSTFYFLFSFTSYSKFHLAFLFHSVMPTFQCTCCFPSSQDIVSEINWLLCT